MLIFQWCFHPTSALLGLLRVDPCAVLLHRQRCYLHLTPCLFDWVAHVFSLPLVVVLVSLARSSRVPGLLRIKKWGNWKKTRNRRPERLNSRLFWVMSLLLPAAKKNTNKKEGATCSCLTADSSRRRRGEDSAPLLLLVALWGRTDAAHASRHIWRARGARKASIKPQLGNLGSTGCTDLFLAFCCRHVPAPRFGPASGRPE